MFFNNVPADEFSVHHGESFRIGNTLFTLHDEDAPIEISVAAKEVRNVRFENADKRIEALAALPEIIRQSPDDARLEHQVVQALMEGILHAEGAAVVRLLPETTDEEIKLAVCASGRAGSPPARSARAADWCLRPFGGAASPSMSGNRKDPSSSPTRGSV